MQTIENPVVTTGSILSIIRVHNMRIGELAKRTKTKIDTVRYYEKAGLLPQPPRQPNRYRDYDNKHLQRLSFIRHCRALNMPLDNIRSLLSLLDNPKANCEIANNLIDTQLDQVRERIVSLQNLEQQLQALRTQCCTQAPASECGILRELVTGAQNGDCICHPSERDK